MITSDRALCHTIQRYYDALGRVQVDVCNEDLVTEEKHYGSEICRVTCSLKDGKDERTVSVILKESTLDKMINEAIEENVHFTSELQMYLEVLPCMERLCQDTFPDCEPLWPHCLGHMEDTKIVLEDLKVLGYKLTDRQTGMDYEHASLSIRSLAKFHALSMALINNGTVSPGKFSKFVFGGDYSFMNDLSKNRFDTLLKAIKDSWSGEWKDVLERLGRLPSSAAEKVKEMRLQPCKWNVINHGDPWVNNIMFKYKKGTTSPESVRFVDYQLSHYGSFGFDLHYFINTSLSIDLLPSTEKLLLEYTQTLQEQMKHFGLKNIPTFHQVLDEMKRLEFFGLFTAVSITPIIIAPPELAPPRFNQDLPLEEIVSRNVERFRTEEYTRRIQIILRRAQHGGFFERMCG
uniref:CHK kinase-like domain-containing protein n=3 Tax=Lygus hesperus TaxID=30085 RepID=A0A146L0I5_LYGHE